MSMTTETAAEPQQRFVFYDVSWDKYEALLEALGDNRLRHTYFEGTLEVMSPALNHEWMKSLLGELVAIICLATTTPKRSFGSTTTKRRRWKRGLEPDAGFFVGAESVQLMIGKEEFDPDTDPPPELIIEIDVTASSDERMEFYRRLRVLEVWRRRGGSIHFYRLGKDGKYRQSKKSGLFPFLSAADLTRFVLMGKQQDDISILSEFDAWVRSRAD